MQTKLILRSAYDRIETVKRLIPIEGAADLIFECDARRVKPAASRDRECICDIECIKCIYPAVLIGSAKRDRTDRNWIAGLSKKYPATAGDEI